MLADVRSAILVTVWAIGGLLLTLLLVVFASFMVVVGLLGGPLLGVILIPMILLSLPAIAIVGYISGGPERRKADDARRVEVGVIEEAERIAASVPVMARLEGFRGACDGCPAKVKMDTLEGQEFVFPNGNRTDPAMCGPARRLLARHVQMVRAGDGSHHVELVCPIVAGNRLAFDLRLKVAA